MKISALCANGVTYLPVPSTGKILSVKTVAQAAAGAAGSVVIADGANTVVTNAQAGAAAGAISTSNTFDATYGENLWTSADTFKITTSSTNSVAFFVEIEFDEFNRDPGLL